MELVRNNEYLIGTVGTDGLVPMPVKKHGEYG